MKKKEKLAEQPNYYKETYDKANLLMLNNKLLEALEILNEELNMPYIPQEFEFKYNNLKKEINLKLMSDKNSQKIISFDFLFNFLKEFKDKNNEELHMMLSNFMEFNMKKKTKELQEIFNFTNIDNWVKAEIFDILVDQNVDYEFKISNSIVNPSKSSTFDESKEIGMVSSLLENAIDEPMIRDTSISLFDFYLKSIFPKKVDLEKSKLYAASFETFATKIIKKNFNPNLISKKWDIDKKDIDNMIKSIDSFN